MAEIDRFEVVLDARMEEMRKWHEEIVDLLQQEEEFEPSGYRDPVMSILTEMNESLLSHHHATGNEITRLRRDVGKIKSGEHPFLTLVSFAVILVIGIYFGMQWSSSETQQLPPVESTNPTP